MVNFQVVHAYIVIKSFVKQIGQRIMNYN